MNLQPFDLENIDEEMIEELNKRQPHDLQTEIDIFKEIIKQHLKSAVDGLLEEVKQKKIDIAKLQNPEEVISMTKKELVNEVNIEIDEILLIIKKWFPNILES